MRRAVALLAVLVLLAPALAARGLAPTPAAAQDTPPTVVPAAPAAQTPIDTDGDGAPDDADNCPAAPNPDQANADGDALGDACDAAPLPPPPDSDGDGVPDATDNCPAVANPDQLDGDADGLGNACDAPAPAPTPVPVPDGDADGVPDASDNCPAVANPDQADADADRAGDACDVPPTAVPSPTETPTPSPSPSAAPAESPTETPTPTPSPSPSPSPSPTPVTLGPDDASLFGWPSSVGGRALYVPPDVARLSEPVVVARINAGGPALTTVDGAVWSADAAYTSGIPFQRHVDADIAATDADDLYRSERRGRTDGDLVHYAISVPAPGTYAVNLHVAARGAPVAADGTAGVPGVIAPQLLTVNLEDGPAELVDWQIPAIAAALSAVVQPLQVDVTDGTLDVVLVASAGRPGVAALEVLALGTPGDAIVEFALRHLGLPYVWATQGPNSFDCSGFTDWVVSNVLGSHIGYNQVEQIYYGTAVAAADLRPGDLVFFFNTHPIHEGVSHVGIYVGNGTFVHASTGAGAVVVDDLTWGYYASHYYAAVRLA